MAGHSEQPGVTEFNRGTGGENRLMKILPITFIILLCPVSTPPAFALVTLRGHHYPTGKANSSFLHVEYNCCCKLRQPIYKYLSIGLLSMSQTSPQPGDVQIVDRAGFSKTYVGTSVDPNSYECADANPIVPFDGEVLPCLDDCAE